MSTTGSLVAVNFFCTLSTLFVRKCVRTEYKETKRIKEHYLIIIFYIFRKTEFWRVHITGKELKEYILQKEKKKNKSYQQLSCRTDLMILFQSIPVSANLILL